MLNMNQHATIWDKKLSALDAFVDREGHALVPAKHVEKIDGEEHELGSWVSYVRTRYRNDALPIDRVSSLESHNGWEWGPLRPGPKPDDKRDGEIKKMRTAGKSLQEIGTTFGLSRQRIHQIVAT